MGEITRAARIETLAQQVLDVAPPRFALGGFSMGGIVAMEIARQAPHRLTHLALLNTTARADAAPNARMAQLRRVVAGHLDAVIRDELKPRYLGPSNKNPEVLSLVSDMARSLGVDVFSRQTVALMVRESLHAHLSAIRCPTLVLTGADDLLCPPAVSREIAAPIEGARLLIVRNCGHLSPLERPEIVSEALVELILGQAALGKRPELRLVADNDR